jgi:hypothetical protein
MISARQNPLVVAVLAIFALLHPTQASQPQVAGQGLQAYAGTWVAELNGKTYAQLALKLDQGKISGTLAMGDIDVSSTGEVSRVNTEAQNPSEIFDTKLAVGPLQFKVHDGDEIDNYTMTLADADKAKLQLLQPPNAPADMPNPKPFTLKRKS